MEKIVHITSGDIPRFMYPFGKATVIFDKDFFVGYLEGELPIKVSYVVSSGMFCN